MGTAPQPLVDSRNSTNCCSAMAVPGGSPARRGGGGVEGGGWSSLIVTQPRPHPLTGKRQLLHDFLVVTSLNSEQTLTTSLHDVGATSLICVNVWMTWHYFIGLSKIETGD